MAFVPDEAAYSAGEVSGQAFKLFTYYCARRNKKTGKAWANPNKIEDEIGIHPKYQRQLMKQLIEKGWAESAPDGTVVLLKGFTSAEDRLPTEPEENLPEAPEENLPREENLPEPEENLPPEEENLPQREENLPPHIRNIEPAHVPAIEPAKEPVITKIAAVPKVVSSESPPKQRARDPLFEEVAQVCRIDWKICSEGQRNQLNQTVGILRREGRTPEQVRQVGDWWYAWDWRGKNNQAPTPAQLRDVWAQAFEPPPLMSAKSRQNAGRWDRFLERRKTNAG